MASSDLIVRVKMADVQKFVSDGKSVESATEGIGRSGSTAGRIGSAGLGLISSAMGKLISTAKWGGLAMVGFAGFVAKTGIGFNAAFQDAETSLKTLLGSTGAAKQMMDDLRSVSDGTPLLFTEVLSSAQQLLGMGVAAKRVKPLLTALNGAVIANGKGSEEYARASLALAQIQGKGKASMEELLQITEAGIPVLPILQKELGLTADQIANIGNEGISAEKVLDALSRGWHKEFGKAAEEARNNFSNQTAQIRKDWQQMRRIVTQPLFEKLNKDVLPRLGKTVRGATTAFSEGFKAGGMMAGLDLMVTRADYLIGAGGRISRAWQPFSVAIRGFGKGFQVGGIIGGIDMMVRRLDHVYGLGGNLVGLWRDLEQAGRDLGTIVKDGVAPALLIIASVAADLPTPFRALTGLLGLIADHTGVVKVAVLALVGAFAVWKTATLASIAVNRIHGTLIVLNTARTKGMAAAVALNTEATKGATLAQRLLNVAMRMNPIGIVITALAALAAGIYIAYQRSETFRAAVQWLWDKVKATFFWIRDNWKLLAVILGGPIGAAVAVIATHWGSIKRGARGVIDFFMTVWGGLKDYLIKPFTDALAPILNTVDAVRAAVSWIPGFGGGGGGVSPADVQAVQDDVTRRMRGPTGTPTPAGLVPPSLRPPGGWTGVNVARGGSLVVGERGRELITLPAGAQVHRNSATEQSLGQGNERPIIQTVVMLDRQVLLRALSDGYGAVVARA